MGYSSVSFNPSLIALNSDAASSALAEANVASAAAVAAQSKASDASSAAATKLLGGYYGLTDGATIAIDWNNGGTQRVVLGGTGRTVTFANPVDGQVYRFVIIQDGTGSRTITTWPTIKWAGGSAPTLTITANQADIITLLYANSIYYGDCSKNF